jgi:hypothetical protein
MAAMFVETGDGKGYLYGRTCTVLCVPGTYQVPYYVRKILRTLFIRTGPTVLRYGFVEETAHVDSRACLCSLLCEVSE